ncbi:MAG TPA: BTAD domain-containing putative transcriptional regulator, partial [Nocardioides sp.]|nr:BTAD domain-containing putative transcriptional regulator [Nocardioides sp.]
MTAPVWTYRAGMEVSVLGPLRVTGRSGAVDIRGIKERTLLAHLVAADGRMVPTGDLIDSLWGEEPPRTAAKALQTYVLRLRNVLEPDRDGAPTLLVTDGPGYRLAADHVTVDADEFARLVQMAQNLLDEGQLPAAATTVTEALALWRGPAYAGFEDTAFGRAESRRLDELRLTAREVGLGAELRMGRSGAVVAEVERLVEAHPLQERWWQLLVLALYREGRQSDALAAYQRARQTLADELGVDPGPELRRLHDQVLAQHPDLDQPRREGALPPTLAGHRGPLLGRDRELEALRAAWRRVQDGAALHVALSGPPGAGATRLAAALAQEVARSGHEVSLAEDGVAGNGRARLVVADGTPVPEPGPGTLVVSTTAAGAPGGAEELTLGPLDDGALAELLGRYVDTADAERLVPEVREESGGWPGPAHRAALRHARALAARRAESAVLAAEVSRSGLAVARGELRDAVATHNETSRALETVDTGLCPWRGLDAYRLEDARWFAGRERLIAELVARLADCRLLAVVGASGSGKSSLLNAGLLASLADDALPGSAAWTRLVMRPGRVPMRELARVALGRPRADIGDLLAHLVRSQDEGADRTVLVVDQLEEVWTTCDDAGERQAFLDSLVELVTDPGSTVSVVLGVRADYVSAVAAHPALAGLLGDATLLVGAPTPDEVRRAVERPAARAGLRLADGLTDTIVADAGAEPGLLPLLSSALTQLWALRRGPDLTFEAYVALGGLRGAIAHLAESAFEQLDPPEQQAARTLVLRLAGPGEGSAVTRRRVPLDELAGLPTPGVRAVVEKLADARLLSVSEGHVEVAHEALFREWPRLRAWLEEDAAGRGVQRRLALAASEWAAEGRDPALLWRGARLEAGLDVAAVRPDEVTATEREFLAAGREALDAQQREAEDRAATTSRQNRRLRRSLVLLALVLAVALVAGFLAQRARQDAQAAAVAADAKRLAATALNEEYPDLALLSAVEAVRTERSAETYGALLTLLARAPEVVTRFRTPERFLRVAVTGDDSTVVLSENGPVMRGLDAATGEQLWQRAVPGDGQVGTLTPMPDGTRVFAVLFSEGLVGAMFDGATGRELWRVTDEDVLARTGPDGSPYVWHQAGLLDDGTLRLSTETHVVTLDPRRGTVLDTVPFPEPMPYTETSQVWPDGRVSFSFGDTGSVFDPARPARGLVDVAGTVMAVSPDGRRVAVTTETDAGAVLRLHDSATLEPVSDAFPLGGLTRFAEWTPDGRTLAVAVDERVQLRDGRTGDLREEIAAHSGTVLELAAVDDDLLWTAGRDGTAVLLDLTGTRGTLRERPLDTAVHAGTGAPGTDLAVVVRWVEEAWPAQVVDTRTGKSLFGDLPLPGFEECVCQVETVALTPG